jgi:hypothetical protein
MGGKGNRSLLGGGPLVPKTPPRARPQVVESTEPPGGFRGDQFSSRCESSYLANFTIVLRVSVELLVTTAGPPLNMCQAAYCSL